MTDKLYYFPWKNRKMSIIRKAKYVNGLMTALLMSISIAASALSETYVDYSQFDNSKVSTETTHTHDCTVHTHQLSASGLEHAHNAEQTEPAQDLSKKEHVHNGVVHKHKLSDEGFNHTHDNVRPDQQASGLSHTHNCLIHTHLLAEMGLEHIHEISSPSKDPSGVTHTHNGVAHTHRLPKKGLKHSHVSPYPKQSKVTQIHTYDIQSTHEKSSGITHTHNNIPHRHRLPKGKLKHVHNAPSYESSYKITDVKTETHNTLASSFFSVIDRALFYRSPNECYLWQANMKVIGKADNNTRFSYYPDVMAACSENVSDSEVRTDPVLITEVLSPLTQQTDLVEKLNNYTTIPSLMEYIVISQDSPLVRLYRRRTGWMLESYYPEDHFVLESLGHVTIYISDIYRRARGETEISY